MVQYKFSYVDARGIGEASRFILHYVNIDFEDHRISREEWDEGKLKQEMPFGQMPVLTIDGKTKIAQSYAIARFLAKRTDLAGKDDIESAFLDSLADLYKDFWSEASVYIYTVAGYRQGDKDQIYNEKFVPAVEKFFPFFVKSLKESDSGFFAKSGVSWVDFHVANSVQTILNLASDVLKNYPEILEHHKRVHGLPQLQKYLTSRKESQL